METTDPYAVFVDIFGSEPPAGRVPYRSSSPPAPEEPIQINRSVSQVWTGIKKQVLPQRSASASSLVVGANGVNNSAPATSGIGMNSNVSSSSAGLRHHFHSHPQTTRGGRAIPLKHDVSAFAYRQHSVHDLSTLNGSEASSSVALNGATPSRKASSSTISSLGGGAGSQKTIVTTPRKVPMVYPALLSRVAQKFQEQLQPMVGDRTKNELTYKQAFTGQEAVDTIAHIIRTPDRNLALLLGRALDAQKLFHDVTYDNRLRDSPHEVYQFTGSDEAPETNGVFTLLGECYSPTCTRDRLCYSIACPRRLEQLARLNMKLVVLSNQQEPISWADEEKEHKLWSQSVPKEVVESTPKEEQKRQEVICEFIYTERNFVKDLEYLREYYIKPLRRANVIPEARREKFIRTVFLNILEIHALNLKFADALTKRQQQNDVVAEIGDVVCEFAPRFEPFIRYGAAQMYAKYELERERSANPAFAKFVAEVERLPESNQLELHGYLSKPTTRLARYPLLLDQILKHTSQEIPDHTNIPKATATIRDWLTKLNAESGKAENHLALRQLNQQLTFRAGDYVDLHLTDERRRMVYKGMLGKRPGEATVQVYLFDKAILFAKRKKAPQANGREREVLRVNSRPIHLELLQLAESDEKRRIRNAVTRSNSEATVFPLTFQHLGRRGYELTLYADSFQARKTWVATIEKQRLAFRESNDVYTQYLLQSTSFKVLCAKPMDGGRKLLYGTDRGIYLSEISFVDGDSTRPRCSSPIMVVRMTGAVTQIDTLDKYGILLVLCDKTISALPLDCLEKGSDAVANSRRLKQIATQATFYKVDECLGRTLLSVVKSHAMSATVRVLETANPIMPASQGRRPPLRRLITGDNANAEGFTLFKPAIEVPSATLTLSYLRSHLCLGCARGFELLDLETLKFESLLDPADTSLDFVIRRESLRPISLYRIDKEFLLNYSDFSFFINRNGWRSRPDWTIQWECVPQSIVLSYPYLVAFDTNLIEIRNMDGELLRIIPGENIRFLHESTHDILYVHENEKGQDEVVSLNFWEKVAKQRAAAGGLSPPQASHGP